MKPNIRPFPFIVAMAALIISLTMVQLTVTGCKTQRLEPGGVYSPTNAAGERVINDRALALTDASYKFAYETTLSIFKFEKDNRAAIAALSPTVGAKVKTALDQARTKVWEIDQRWALARRAYRANPTPAGLSALQTALSEIERLVPVIQAELSPLNAALTQ